MATTELDPGAIANRDYIRRYLADLGAPEAHVLPYDQLVTAAGSALMGEAYGDHLVAPYQSDMLDNRRKEPGRGPRWAGLTERTYRNSVQRLLGDGPETFFNGRLATVVRNNHFSQSPDDRACFEDVVAACLADRHATEYSIANPRAYPYRRKWQVHGDLEREGFFTSVQPKPEWQAPSDGKDSLLEVNPTLNRILQAFQATEGQRWERVDILTSNSFAKRLTEALKYRIQLVGSFAAHLGDPLDSVKRLRGEGARYTYANLGSIGLRGAVEADQDLLWELPGLLRDGATVAVSSWEPALESAASLDKVFDTAEAVFGAKRHSGYGYTHTGLRAGRHERFIERNGAPKPSRA